MGCLFSCFHPRRRETSSRIDDSRRRQAESLEHRKEQPTDGGVTGCAVSFTFKDLATATQNFKGSNLLGEGGFGKVFRGRLESGQVVAIKQLNLEGLQGPKEFLTEVLILSTLRHPNLVNLVGYCIEGDQRLLVYEFMSKGSLEDHLFRHHRYPDAGWPEVSDYSDLFSASSSSSNFTSSAFSPTDINTKALNFIFSDVEIQEDEAERPCHYLNSAQNEIQLPSYDRKESLNLINLNNI